MIYLIGIAISCCVSGYVLFSIMEALYEKKYPNKKLYYYGAYVLYVILSVAVSWYGIPGINVLYSILILCTMSYYLYNTGKKNFIFNSIIVIIYLAFVDLIITIIFSIFIETNAYSALANDKFFLISGIGNALAMLCTCNLLIQLIMHYQINEVSKSLHAYTLFLLAFEIGIFCFYMENHVEDANDIGLFILAVGFVVVDGGVLYLFKMLSKNAVLEMRTELAERQCELTVKYYEGIKSQYEETQKIVHDFKKHIQVLESLDSNQAQLKENYIHELINSINSTQQQFKCDDEIVCTIIGEKIKECEQENIALELNLQDIKFDFMERIEVTSLFANLLDNAIEACRESKKDKKEIYLRIHTFKDYTVIRLRNTIGSLPIIREGNLQSTKAGHLGMGMTNLSNLANKYCGNVDFNYSEDYFETKIILADEKQ